MSFTKKVSRFSILPFVLFSFFTLIFFYFRVTPIVNQTIPYTFDQGRDFLKAYDIVHNGNITLLGPTTGIEGLFHGVWWYYFLAIPYILFQGNPLGFALFISLTSYIQTILFSFFLKKKFGFWQSILFFSLIAISPYFIQMSLFAISSILILPFLLLFFFALYTFMESKQLKYLFLIFLGLGFIFEAEIPMGAFLIPSVLCSIVILRQSKKFFGTPKKFLYSFVGLFIPMVPRLLFEMKHNFIQTKALLRFLTLPAFRNPSSFQDIVAARFSLFYTYYNSLFPEHTIWIAALFFVVSCFGFAIVFKKLSKSVRIFILLIYSILFFLFFFSLFYKDNFWSNYYEGLPYFFALLLSLGMLGFTKRFSKFVPYFLIGLLFLFSVKTVVSMQGRSVKNEGMKEQINVVEYIYNQVGRQDFCVRIYTPPAIPHTYNYLFTYYSNTKKYKYFSHDFIQDRCFYIIEKDDYQFRIDKWRSENIPKSAILLKKNNTSPSIIIELWQQHKK